MSLRARLLIGLIALTAVGLLVAGLVTYRAERSFLYRRVNTQLLTSVKSVEAQVDVSSGLRDVRMPKGAAGGAPAKAGAGAVAAGTAPPVNFPGGAAGLPYESLADPPGTFGEYLNRAGKVQGVAVGYSSGGGRYLAPPKLPAHYPRTTSLAHPHAFTAQAVGHRNLSYLVLAVRSDIGPGTTIVAVSLTDVDASLSRLKDIEAIVIGSVLVALALLAWLMIRIGLRPLERIAQTAGAIADGDLSRRVSPAGGRTEVGRLGLALNAMLGQIEEAFGRRKASEERLRRFLSDASHELRTPLTSIRGYAELFRLGATASPEDTAKAMQRIEEEAARMGVLVEELLALARLDEMPQTAREPVDLASLVSDAADDARAVAKDRVIALVIDPPPLEGAAAHVVSGDPHQLRQVLANVVSNALKHTPAGTPVEIALRSDEETARITVRDHGPGLPADANDAVFERFWRAEVGRERGRAGAGLGLAIVAEIVAAHAGSVSAHNAPDGGAVFVIELATGAAGAALPPPR